MTSDLEKLQEEFDNEIKDFINGIKGLQKKESAANEEKGVSLLSTQDTLLAGMKMAKTLKHHYFYLLYLLKKEASTK